jgi:hypothetical protein
MKLDRRHAAQTLLASAACGLFPAGPPGSLAAHATRQVAEERMRTQVCVIGGGSGGTGAALAAARAGANVVLLERDSCLGGTATNAMVCVWRAVAGSNGIPRDLFREMRNDPLGVADVRYEATTLGARTVNGQRRSGGSVPFEPRAMDYATRALLEATRRCQTLLATTFCGVRMADDRIEAVEAWFAGKRLRIEADVYVDCTGDGDVCADAGCECRLGEDPRSLYNEPHAPETARLILNGLTLCYRITDTGVQQKPYLPKGVEVGKCGLSACLDRMPNGDRIVNVVPMLPGNALLHCEYSVLMRKAQHRVLDHMYQLQTLPGDHPMTRRLGKGRGLGTWAIAAIAPRIGVRETRRIITDYVLRETDLDAGVARQGHPDVIAIADHSVDLHAPGVEFRTLEGPFGIPYRCLLPRGVRNLMIACRAAGFSHIAAASCRLQRTLITLGQAAGNAAALAVQHHLDLRQVDIRQLQARLQSQGVELTAPASTPNV